MGTSLKTFPENSSFYKFRVQRRNVRTSLRPLHLLTDVGGDGQQRTAALLVETAVVGSVAKNESLKRRF